MTVAGVGSVSDGDLGEVHDDGERGADLVRVLGRGLGGLPQGLPHHPLPLGRQDQQPPVHVPQQEDPGLRPSHHTKHDRHLMRGGEDTTAAAFPSGSNNKLQISSDIAFCSW